MTGTRRIVMALGVAAALVYAPMAVSFARTPTTSTEAPASAPQAVDPVAQSDFDDDGFQDLAIGAPGATVDTQGGPIAEAGKVFVLYGTAQGLSTARVQEWHQDVEGIAFGPGTGDHFGSALASGDFDRDGVADLAIGVPGENRFIGGVVRSDAGLVEVIYGTAGVGLTAAGDDAITPTSAQFPGESQSLRWVESDFGASISALDWYDTVDPINRAPDGFADLAIGAPGFDDGTGIVVGLRGPNIAPNPFFEDWLAFDLIPIVLPEGSRPASSLAKGNLDGEGFDDLAVGCPLCDVDDGTEIHRNAGMVVVFGKELSPQILQEGSGGNVATPGNHDLFGVALATGDFDRDGIDELAVGAPGKNLDGSIFAGQVQIYTGSPAGLGAPFRTVDERAAAVISDAVSLERFGQSLGAGNFGRGAGIDLAIGALREKVGSVSGAGAVFVLYNTGTGLTAVDSQRFTQNTVSIPNQSEANDSFGNPLAVGQFRRGRTHDLVIGVELEDLPADNAHRDAGLVHVLYGKRNGLTATDDQTFNMASAGLPGLQDRARFGAALR